MPAASSSVAVPGVLTPATALALQRTIGNANVARLARAPKAAIARAPATRQSSRSARVWPTSRPTRHRPELPAGSHVAQRGHQGDGCRPRDGQAGARADRDRRTQAHNFIQGGDKPYDPGWADHVREGLEEIRQMRRDIQYEKDAPKREAIAKAAAEAQRLVTEYKKLEPKLLDAARRLPLRRRLAEGARRVPGQVRHRARHRPRPVRDVARHHQRAGEGQEPRGAPDRQARRGHGQAQQGHSRRSTSR